MEPVLELKAAIALLTALLTLVGAGLKLFRQYRKRKRNRRMIFKTGMEWHGEPPIIVQGWIEEDGTFTLNKNMDKELRKARQKWEREAGK